MDLGVILFALMSGLTSGVVYGLVGLGISAIFKGTGIVNAMQGEFAVLAAIFAAVAIGAGLPAVVAMALSIVVVTALGALIELTLVRPMIKREASGVAFLLLTLGLSLLSGAALLFFFGRDARSLPGIGGSRSIEVAGASIRWHAIAVIVIAVAVALIVRTFYRRTVSGLAMMAAALDSDGATATGINVNRTRLRTFAIGAAIGALAGILIAPLTPLHYLSGVVFTLKGFAAAVLGGLTQPMGAIAGGVVFGVVESFAALVFPSSYRDVVAFAVMIIVLIGLPRGLLATRLVRQGG